MGRKLGIGALVIAVIAFLLPVLGNVVVWIALAAAIAAALYGEKLLSIVTVLVTALGYTFLKPDFLANGFAELDAGNTPWEFIVTTFMLAAVVLAVQLHGSGRFRLGE